MANEHPNKVILGNETLIDISSDTATAEDVTAGKTFHLASGAPATGTANYVTSLNGETGALSIKTINNEAVLGSGDISIQEGTEMVVLAYGKSTWADFMSVYPNAVVYCRASSNSNPASGSQTRMAFMAYVNNETNPTNVEFQYYRSVSSHSATQQGDQVYVYKLDKTAGWTVTVREAYTRITAGTGMTQSYSGGVLTLQAPRELPTVSASDNGKVLGVVNGAWAKTSSGGGGGSSWTDISAAFVAANPSVDVDHCVFMTDGTFVYASGTAVDEGSGGVVDIACPSGYEPSSSASVYAGTAFSTVDFTVTPCFADSSLHVIEINGASDDYFFSIMYPVAQS